MTQVFIVRWKPSKYKSDITEKTYFDISQAKKAVNWLRGKGAENVDLSVKLVKSKTSGMFPVDEEERDGRNSKSCERDR